MNNRTYLNFNSAFYKKALEISYLSKKISDYLNTDLSVLSDDGTENPNIYFSGDIIQQSVSLSSEVLKAQQTTKASQKYVHAHTLEWLTYRMTQSCKRLSKCNSDGRDFILILKKEINKFKKLQKQWVLSL
jgi:hypothetical protein